MSESATRTSSRSPIPRAPIPGADYASGDIRELDAAEQEREFAAMDLGYNPSNMLPDPPEHPDWVYRWVSYTIHGESNQANVVRRRHEGWRPVLKKEMPEFAASLGDDGLGHEEIRMVSLVLHRMPRARAEMLKERLSRQPAASQEKFQVSGSDAAMGKVSDLSSQTVTRGRAISFGDGR